MTIDPLFRLTIDPLFRYNTPYTISRTLIYAEDAPVCVRTTTKDTAS
jgi:hypothetical protein